jgi:hypothetical protein
LVPSDWRPTPRQGLWAIRIGVVLGLLVAIGYSYGITLWDWAKLLIVPAVIAAGGLWFNTQQREREQRIAANRARDDSLQAYLDGMSQLLTDKDRPLHRAPPGDSLSTVARARTLTVLSRLDAPRKRSVMEFLYESHLIERRHNIVSLQFADLRLANLSDAYLSGADLRLANLSNADLSDANLSDANLSGVYKVTDEETIQPIINEELVQQTKSLEGATMPNGQKYEDWRKDREKRQQDE